MRKTHSLAGQWEFQIDPNGVLELDDLTPTTTIPVPMPWQAALPELRLYSGYAWYRRTFTVPADWLNKQILLTFGAVDYWCEVFINGHCIGEHEGGYMPFTFEIRDAVREGENTIVLRVYDSVQEGILIPRDPKFPTHEGINAPPFPAEDVPHGKQEWYVNVGGMWQDVTLTTVPRNYIETVHVTPSNDGTAKIDVRFGGTFEGAGQPVEIEILLNGQRVAHSSDVIADANAANATLRVDSPQLWSPDTPTLYNVIVRFNGDEYRTRFGFREFVSRDGALFLNSEPIYLLAALDQDLYPETIYTPPSEEYLRDQFRKAKELGLNCLRCHIKPADPRYLDLCDEMGLLVWAEIPSWRTFMQKGSLHPHQLDIDAALRGRVEALLDQMVARDYNHPSIVIWTLVNEDWGTTLPLSAADREWVKTLYDTAKRLDSTRLVVDNSACPNAYGPNIHVKSDIDDWHAYANIPDNAKGFEPSSSSPCARCGCGRIPGMPNGAVMNR
jgi:beta-galactosidase/beta-glucuronidase